MAPSVDEYTRHSPSFAALFFGKLLLVLTTIIIVWGLYAYLHVFHLDWLGWFYAHLLPLTNSLYGLIENSFPSDMRYQIRAAISEDLGQRSLFLLLLTAVVELTLYSIFKFLKWLTLRLVG
jgi:hypothetical protein